MSEAPDLRLTSPAAHRNAGPILDVLRATLPESGGVLEVASGSGQHGVYFARALPRLTWQPSDPEPRARRSIDAWAKESGCPNLRPALELDVRLHPWPLQRADAVVCINMLHIAPWEAAEGLLTGAGRLLDSGGALVLYGPFRRDGNHTASSNARFDADLRNRNPAWGIRDLEAVTDEADRHALDLQAVVEMPANNLSVVLRRR